MTNLTFLRRTALSTLFLPGVALAIAQTPQSSLALPAFRVSAMPAVARESVSSAATAKEATPFPAAANGEPDVAFSSSTASDSVGSRPLSTDPTGPADSTSTVAGSTLPDAPSAVELHAALPIDPFLDAPQATPNVAPRLTKYIPAGSTAQTLTARDKFRLGVRDLYSPLNFVAMFASAGYEHVTNGEPNYGTDRGAFGERLGAAAIRESSQGFLTDSVLSPIFHEDPRYYVQGYGHSFLYRTAYAVTRPFITRSDNGSSTVNAALLVGYAASAGISYAYYPSINQNAHDTVATFGTSLGGAALGYFVSEFTDDALKAVHLKKK